MKKELIFLGPPACGKGTQTNRLSEFLGFPHVDTGSLLRAEISKETEEGKIAKSFIDKGQLVPAELVGKIIAKRLADEDCKNGYVLDVNKGEEASFKAIYFDIDTQILIERIIYRESCPVCGEIYNKKFKPSKVAGKCDKCNVDLKTRADDNEETAKLRFETYFKETAPLVKFYEDKGVLYKIDANGSIDEVWERLLKVVNA